MVQTDPAGSIAASYKQLYECRNDPAQWHQKALGFLAQGHPDKCKLVLNTLLHQQPKDIPAHLSLATAALSEATPASCDQAVASSREACKLAASSSQGGIQAQAACALGVALGHKARLASVSLKHRTELRQEALEVLQAGLPHCSKAQLKAYFHYNLGVLQAELGEVTPAMQHQHDALETAEQLPGQVDELLACSVMHISLLLTGKQQLATALSTLAVLDQPVSGSAPSISSQLSAPRQLLLARMQAAILMAQGDTSAALAVMTLCKQAVGNVSKAASPAQVWQEMAVMNADVGAVADACYCAQQALQADPESAASHAAAGRAHEVAGRQQAALDSYSAALALDPHHALSMQHMGTLLLKTGSLTQMAAARDMLTEALRLEPSSAPAWYQLGRACTAMHHHVEAERNLRTAVQLAACSPVLPYSNMPLLLPPVL